MNTTDARKLVYEFMSLPTHRRVEIGMSLKALPRNFLDMDTREWTGHIFRVVKKKKMESRMWELVFPTGQS